MALVFLVAAEGRGEAFAKTPGGSSEEGSVKNEGEWTKPWGHGEGPEGCGRGGQLGEWGQS